MEVLRKTSKSGVTYRIVDSLPYPASGNPAQGCFEIERLKMYEDCQVWFPALHEPGCAPKLFSYLADVMAEFDRLLAS